MDDRTVEAINALCEEAHADARAKGFWPDGVAGKNFGEQIALMHSELSEALEGHRADAMDDHLPEYPQPAVEFADTVIRILDNCGAHGWPLGEIVRAKLAYNRDRPHRHGKRY